MKKNLLVTLSDENYIDQAKQFFSSAYWNAGWKGDYMLLSHEIPEEKLKWFRKKGILIKKCKPFYDKKIVGYPLTVLSKFYLFTPYFKKWKNIIYLDADMVVGASLDELTEIKGFAAVKGLNHISRLFMSSIEIKIREIDKKVLIKLRENYNLIQPGFSSCAMIFSTDLIKKDIFLRLKELFQTYKEIMYGDEAIMNLLFYKKWIKLHKIYNIDSYSLNNLKNIKSGKLKGMIFHFGKRSTNKKDYFYKEWKANINKAELINLKKIPAAKKFSKEEIQNFQKLVEKNEVSLKMTLAQIRHFTEKTIGLVGISLKNNCPRLYFILKGLSNK
jgi:lipopolysaccharide biosynthesis glycosyltransferase